MKRFLAKSMLVCLALAIVAQPGVTEDKKSPLDDLKCFIMKKRKVKGKKVVKHKGADLYLCCAACVKRFGKTPEKYESFANHQVVLTGQFVQKSCPVSGEAVNDGSPKLAINGVDVLFSSDEHKDKISQLKGDEQLKAVFGAAGFKSGRFELVEKEKS